jgi:SNF family Na+-dependent transporter
MATIIGLPGQLMFAGDKLGTLREDRMKIIQQVLPVADIHPQNLYPYAATSMMPIWNLSVTRPFGTWRVVALFNFTDAPRTFDVALDGLGSNGLWVPGQSLFGVHTWNDCWLDFMDAWSEGFMMPLGAFLTCLFVGYELKIGTLADEIEQDGIKFRSKKFVEICLKYIAPVILLFVLYNQLKDFGLI